MLQSKREECKLYQIGTILKIIWCHSNISHLSLKRLMYFVVLHQMPEIPIVGLLRVPIIPSYGKIRGQEEDHKRGELVWKRNGEMSHLACEPLLVVPVAYMFRVAKC